MFQHRFSLVPFPLQEEEGQGRKKFGQEEAPADSLVADPPTQAILHPPQASAGKTCLHLLLLLHPPKTVERGANLGGLDGLTPASHRWQLCPV